MLNGHTYKTTALPSVMELPLFLRTPTAHPTFACPYQCTYKILTSTLSANMRKGSDTILIMSLNNQNKSVEGSRSRLPRVVVRLMLRIGLTRFIEHTEVLDGVTVRTWAVPQDIPDVQTLIDESGRGLLNRPSMIEQMVGLQIRV